MKSKVLAGLVIFALLLSLLGAIPVAATGPDGPSYMPPNEDLIIKSLRARGVIPRDATPAQVQAAYMKFIKGATRLDRPNRLEAKQIQRAEAAGKRANKPGRPMASGDVSAMASGRVNYDNIVTILVEFAGTDSGHTGPLHNQIAPPAPGDNTSYWIPDFNRAHYQAMLFDQTPGAKSMANYYLEQSGGVYSVQGKVFAWVQVPHSEWYYGADGSGIDDLNGPVWRVVQDAVAAIGNRVPWADYDKEDPYDLDGDGNVNEPDGYVDHIQFVHAGADQSAGGGAQGSDAIWAHSWWVNMQYGVGPGYGGVQTSDPHVWVGPYTIQSEDGTIGVFCHEFGHDLGLPDQYDTIYSGEASTSFWTIMSGGSWLGCPGEALGTCPASMSAWEKWALGWLEPLIVNPGDFAKAVAIKNTVLPGATGKAVRINLPPYTRVFAVNTPHSGSYEWYSDKGDNLSNTLTHEFSIAAGADHLTFWNWYDTEVDYDYGYVQVSADSGSTWTDVATYNGNSGGWVQEDIDLSAYDGKTVLVRFLYLTDAAVQGNGWAIDDVALGTFSDNVEAGEGAWVANGWYRFEGTANIPTTHYYMAEWRGPLGFDVSMKCWYNFTGADTVEFYKAQPGLLLWYRDTGYTDNWVGVHPWHGQLLVVDAHPQLVLANDLAWLANQLFDPDPNMGLPFRTRIQAADATFGLNPTIAQPLSSWNNVLPTHCGLPALPAAPTFDDSVDYFDTRWQPWFNVGTPWRTYIRNSIDSVDTPTYGLKIVVKSQTATVGIVNFNFRNYAP